MTSQPPSPRVLIAYYSRSGITEGVAAGLAHASGADLEALTTTISRRGLTGYLLSGFEALAERDTSIRPPTHSPGEYDIVLLGSPIWGAALSSPVRTYLNRYAAALPEVGFFVTCGGHGAERALGQMRQISGKTPLATLALTERDLRRHAAVYFGEFWERVLSAWESRTTRRTRVVAMH